MVVRWNFNARQQKMERFDARSIAWVSSEIYQSYIPITYWIHRKYIVPYIEKYI